MSATPSRVTRDGLVVGHCYTGDNGKYLGKLHRIDVSQMNDPDMGSRWRGGSSMVEQKTYVFELDRLVLSGVRMDGGPFFTQVECSSGGAASPVAAFLGSGGAASPVTAFLGSGGALGGAGGGGASSASSSTSNARAPTRASEKLKQNLQSTVLPDGTRFIVGREFLRVEEPYFIVYVRPFGASPLDDKLYKIVLRDLSIGKFFGMSDTTPERFDALQAIVAKFRPRPNNNERRSSRKQRKSRRANRKRGTRQRK